MRRLFARLLDALFSTRLDVESRRKLDVIEVLSSAAIRMGVKMSEQLSRLTREVAETKEAVGRITARLGELAQEIRDGKDDPAKLDALADELDGLQKSVDSAIAATQPAPEPPADPAPGDSPPPSE